MVWTRRVKRERKPFTMHELLQAVQENLHGPQSAERPFPNQE